MGNNYAEMQSCNLPLEICVYLTETQECGLPKAEPSLLPLILKEQIQKHRDP